MDGTPDRCLSGPLSGHLKRAQQAILARKTAGVQALHPGLTAAQADVLSKLLDGARSAAQLAREAGVAPQTMTEMVVNLVSKGWVSRNPSPDHARVLLVSLTEQGREMARQARARADDVEELIRGELSADEEKALVDVLERISTTASERIEVAGRSVPATDAEA